MRIKPRQRKIGHRLDRCAEVALVKFARSFTGGVARLLRRVPTLRTGDRHAGRAPGSFGVFELPSTMGASRFRVHSHITAWARHVNASPQSRCCRLQMCAFRVSCVGLTDVPTRTLVVKINGEWVEPQFGAGPRIVR